MITIVTVCLITIVTIVAGPLLALIADEPPEWHVARPLPLDAVAPSTIGADQ